MAVQCKNPNACCPVTVPIAESQARSAFDALLNLCKTCDEPFSVLEINLFDRMAALGICLFRLFLLVRHQRLDMAPYLADGAYRPGEAYATRTLKTAYGEVTFGRQYLIARIGKVGFFPLDALLGLTSDRLSPWVLQWVARLATRMSFKASQMICKAVLGWAPATETIERVVLGIGRSAAPFMEQLGPPLNDGEVLVIEVDGKCAPMATEAELDKRRGKRKPKCALGCKCQRHRGKANRRARGSKKRKRKADKRKNGKEVTVVVMYTLERGQDGKLHGPRNKKVYGTFAGREAAAKWARAEATKRGFPVDTQKTVQIVLDGASSLKWQFWLQFRGAIFTLDVCHVVERLWGVGRHFHSEGSVELQAWVEELKELVYRGQAAALVKRLSQLMDQTPKQGPGNKGRREALRVAIGFFQPRQKMMNYGELREQDLVIASGQVEGTVRQLVGERFDCAGMRWVRGKAELLLHLRCIEINGDWDAFVNWFQAQVLARLNKGERLQVLTDKPLTFLGKPVKEKKAA
jgi:hypothetical protein